MQWTASARGDWPMHAQSWTFLPWQLNLTHSLKTTIFLSRFLCLALLLQAGQAIAALGQAPSKLAAATPSSGIPSAKMQAAAISPSGLYTIHETVLDSGTTVLEYATPSGQVFAVAWRGPVLPNLNTLLGGYFQTFHLETGLARQTSRLGTPVVIERDGLVLNSMGRMRNFLGHAYAPALVPSGVSIKDVLP